MTHKARAKKEAGSWSCLREEGRRRTESCPMRERPLPCLGSLAFCPSLSISTPSLIAHPPLSTHCKLSMPMFLLARYCTS